MNDLYNYSLRRWPFPQFGQDVSKARAEREFHTSPEFHFGESALHTQAVSIFQSRDSLN
jgi:hypothetical protein